jgi:hypothetical protein
LAARRCAVCFMRGIAVALSRAAAACVRRVWPRTGMRLVRDVGMRGCMEGAAAAGGV